MNLDSIEDINKLNLKDIININNREAALFIAGLSDIDFKRIPFVSPLFDEVIYFSLINLTKQETDYLVRIKDKFNKSIPYSMFFNLNIKSYTNHFSLNSDFPKVTAEIQLIFGKSYLMGSYSGILRKENKLV